MAKPVNLYQGPAPAAMAQMGQGISEAGARIGQILQGGYESMGRGLSKGIDTAVGEYKEFKNMQSQVKSSEKIFETLEPFLPEETRNKFRLQIDSMNNDPSVSLKDKAAFYEQAKGFLGTSIGQSIELQKLAAQQQNALVRLSEEHKLALEKQRLELEARSRFEQERLKNQKEIAAYEATLKARSGNEAPSRSFMLPGGSAFKFGGGVYDE